MDLKLRADAVLFDKDGTLFNFDASWGAWAEAILIRLAAGDTKRASRIAEAVGYNVETKSFSPDSIVVAGTPNEVALRIAPLVDLSLEILISDINAAAAAAPMSPAVPLVPLLDRLCAANIALGVATNDARAPALAHLDQAEITSHFSYFAASDMGFAPKPDPAMCTAFARHLDIAPARIVMVGDSLHDLYAGRAAGMQVVAVRTGMASDATLSPHADCVLDNIGQLPQWLGFPATY